MNWGTLNYREAAGYGVVRLNAEFDEQSGVVKLDVLSDWISQLQEQYDKIHSETFGKITEKEIESAMTPEGGWTKEQLAKWGVPWPPPKGWKNALLGRSK